MSIADCDYGRCVVPPVTVRGWEDGRKAWNSES